MWINAGVSVYKQTLKSFFLAVLFTLSTDVNSACPEFTTSTNPTSILPSSWADVLSSGAYATPQIDGVWVDVHVLEFSDGTTCATVTDDYYKRYCVITGGGDDPDTPDVIEPYDIRAVFIMSFVIECPTYYSYDRNNDICVLIEPELCTPEFCPDGSPIDLPGYPAHCDRPELKQCDDGNWVDKITGLCDEPISEVCTDYNSCLDWAIANTDCGEGSEIQFDYVDPDNFVYTCTTQLPDSPDIAENGGNEDGNPYNDPGITPLEDGSTPTVSETDSTELANAIDVALQDDFSRVEGATRDVGTDIIESIEQQTDDLILNDDQNTEDVTQKIDELIEAQNQTTAAIEDQTFQQSMEDGPCDPTMPDYLSCLTTEIPLSTHSESLSFSESLDQMYARIESSNLVLALSGLTSLVHLEPGSCPVFGFDFPLTGQYISTNIHCELSESIRDIMGLIMTVFWIVIGYKIFASA